MKNFLTVTFQLASGPLRCKPLPHRVKQVPWFTLRPTWRVEDLLIREGHFVKSIINNKHQDSSFWRAVASWHLKYLSQYLEGQQMVAEECPLNLMVRLLGLVENLPVGDLFNRLRSAIERELLLLTPLRPVLEAAGEDSAFYAVCICLPLRHVDSYDLVGLAGTAVFGDMVESACVSSLGHLFLVLLLVLDGAVPGVKVPVEAAAQALKDHWTTFASVTCHFRDFPEVWLYLIGEVGLRQKVRRLGLDYTRWDYTRSVALNALTSEVICGDVVQHLSCLPPGLTVQGTRTIVSALMQCRPALQLTCAKRFEIVLLFFQAALAWEKPTSLHVGNLKALFRDLNLAQNPYLGSLGVVPAAHERLMHLVVTLLSACASYPELNFLLAAGLWLDEHPSATATGFEGFAPKPTVADMVIQSAYVQAFADGQVSLTLPEAESFLLTPMTGSAVRDQAVRSMSIQFRWSDTSLPQAGIVGGPLKDWKPGSLISGDLLKQAPPRGYFLFLDYSSFVIHEYDRGAYSVHNPPRQWNVHVKTAVDWEIDTHLDLVRLSKDDFSWFLSLPDDVGVLVAVLGIRTQTEPGQCQALVGPATSVPMPVVDVEDFISRMDCWAFQASGVNPERLLGVLPSTASWHHHAGWTRALQNLYRVSCVHVNRRTWRRPSLGQMLKCQCLRIARPYLSLNKLKRRRGLGGGVRALDASAVRKRLRGGTLMMTADQYYEVVRTEAVWCAEHVHWCVPLNLMSFEAQLLYHRESCLFLKILPQTTSLEWDSKS